MGKEAQQKDILRHLESRVSLSEFQSVFNTMTDEQVKALVVFATATYQAGFEDGSGSEFNPDNW